MDSNPEKSINYFLEIRGKASKLISGENPTCAVERLPAQLINKTQVCNANSIIMSTSLRYIMQIMSFF
jgi:hypothetical protein